MKPGKRNLITDVAGLFVGSATDQNIKTGVTVLTADTPFVAAVDVMGGAPGTRDTDLLAPDKSVEGVDALVLSGGSAFGLDAPGGVVDVLARRGRGFEVGPVNVPIVPGAILFDLINGGNKNWTLNPYRALGVEALEVVGEMFDLGSVGAGAGATSASLKGGVGSASIVLENGLPV
ncbi:MAG: P1 family peptidase, partial [Devosiaceae bacterium]|nr:P1 family peptidase [Devosiaceae bacterium]